MELSDSKAEQQKRSRRFDRDLYRTCVADGLRAVCYKFLLPPNRVGVKLEDNITSGSFNFSKIMPGEEGQEGAGSPLKWAAPTVLEPPKEFASNLIGSGDLVLLSTSNTSKDIDDPFRGCRYVAALELAAEPRIRKHLRNIYRKHALLTSKPTKKGLDEIDAFHEYYGLHLIRNKPTAEHFPIEEEERVALQASMYMSGAEFDLEMKKRQTESCLLFLNMLKAERTGHVAIHIHLPLREDSGEDWYKNDTSDLMSRTNQDFKALLEPLENVYYPIDGDTDEWNRERKAVLEYAISNFLIPQFEKELRRDLQEAASKLGVKAAAENLKTAALEGPYRPTSLLFTESRFIVPTGDLKMVGVCCVSDNKEASYMAAVDEQGSAVDFLAIPAGTSIHAGAMREKVTMFLLQFRPAAVVVGTSGGYESRMYSRRLTDIVNDAMQRWINRNIQGEDEDDDAFYERKAQLRKFSNPSDYYDDDLEDEEWKCNVELIDDSVSQLYGRSVRSKKEFPEFPVNHKCAISIARYAKDPLAEYTYTWSVASDAGLFGTEMLYLNIHPMQQLLPRTFLLREYERVLCDAVASVGVDINAACQSDHLRGLLLFVPGLGPRKAANIKQVLSQLGGMIGSRRSLLESRYMGPTVYNNAAAFLRMRQPEASLEQYLVPLDDTRIHPDLYVKHKWAIKIAFDALDRDHQDSRANRALKDVMKNSGDEVVRLFNETKNQWEQEFGQTDTFDYKGWDPRTSIPSEHWNDRIDDLNLVAFADKIQTLGQGRWHSHFEMLTWEFRLPYVDPRSPMERLTGDKLFNLITHETDQSLRPGKEVTGKVVSNGDFGSRVKLEGNIEAFIPLRNLSDDHVEAAEEVVQVGQIVTAVVAEVKKEHMTVDLSLKTEDFRKSPNSWPRPSSLPPLDRFFDTRADGKIEEDNKRKREAHVEALQAALGRGSGEDGEGATRRRIGVVARRACTHPSFRNKKHDEVDKELREGGSAVVGEALLRPSSKNSDSLAVHWVVREGSIKVIEVSEDDKENDASIGKKLKIKDQEYGSIDELLARYIGPMNDYVEELINHRKFRDLTEDELDEKLVAEKKANPASIPYGICWMELHAGYASLRFVSSKTPRHHPIGIGPRGFTWGGKCYPILDKLLNDFKRNPRGTSVRPPAPAPAPAVTGDAASRGRWGSRPAAPPPPPPQRPPPPAPPVWQPQPPPRQPPPPPPVPVAADRGWNAPPAYNRGPIPPNLPPPPPPVRPPPPNLPPPPAYNRPPPPPPTRPPPPPIQPPAFGGGGAVPPVGRGRGRTLPAWMSKQS